MFRKFCEIMENRVEIKKYLECFSKSLLHKLKLKTRTKSPIKKVKVQKPQIVSALKTENNYNNI